ncbi:MAG TPA: hypothetical protein VGO00_14060, partial [Kofleriaceae bacterium]|nr:hypothetical protein [Kofleriaceae bacterium]
LAAFALWGARDSMIEWATGGSGVASQRVSAVVEPGYAVLRDERKFAANVSAWREASLPATNDETDRWTGQGYFGARVTDPGVLHSIANDYFPVLVARESGARGLVQGVLLVLGLVVAAAATAGARLRHASDEHRARWLVASVVGALCVYQPLASLGVLPLTGISWPGMGIDSPSDLWFLVIGLAWAMMGADRPVEVVDKTQDRSFVSAPRTERAGFTPACGIDERVRTAPRLRRARKIVVGGLAIAGVAAVIVVARVGSAALGRAGTTTASQHIHDARVDTALRYAQGLACPWSDKTGTIDEVVPVAFGGTPTDPATARFDRELRTAWLTQRSSLVTALRDPAACKGKLGSAQLVSANGTCTAGFSIGWPELRLDVSRTAAGTYHASCAVTLPGDTLAMLRDRPAAIKLPRIRVVGEAMGIAARDVGELVAGTSIVRLRPGTAEATLPTDGFTTAAKVTVATGTTLTVDGARVMLHGPAQLLVADGAAWRRVARAGDVALDRMTLVVAGSRIVLFRPPRAWNGIASVDPLLADDVAAAGERVRRTYPYGAAIPELGWVNPFAVDHSLGLDGWIHAAQTQPASAAASCGTLAPPAVPRDHVCAPSPLDGVMECRVTVQPELALSLRALADNIAAAPEPFTGKTVTPERVSYVVLRGDTGELLAQGDIVPGRPSLAYAPVDAAAETRLIRLREDKD